jgi:hypothetical protein
MAMLKDIYELLLLRRLDARWVGAELHVDVRGSGYAVVDHPVGVAVRKRRAAKVDEKTFAYVCQGPGEAISALGL